MFPQIRPNWLSREHTKTIADFIENNQQLFGSLGSLNSWDGRVINIGSITDRAVRKILLDNRSRIARLIQECSDNQNPLYSDTLQIVRWPTGYYQLPHADKEHPDGTSHPYPWRDFAALTYINDDFEGGNVEMPTMRTTIEPEPGLMVTFPGTLEYLHGVTEITSGTRYTIASFFTWNASRHDGFPI